MAAVGAALRPLWMKVSLVHRLHRHRLRKDSPQTSSHQHHVPPIFMCVMLSRSVMAFRLMAILFRSFVEFPVAMTAPHRPHK